MEGILLMMSVFPAIFGVIGGLLMVWYPLTNKQMIEIEEDLSKRREE